MIVGNLKINLSLIDKHYFAHLKTTNFALQAT